MKNEIKELANSYEAKLFGNTGFYQYEVATPKHTFFSYIGELPGDIVCIFTFRDSKYNDLVEILIKTAQEHSIDLNLDMACKFIPDKSTKFDGILFLGPNSHVSLKYDSELLWKHAIEGMFVYRCEFTGQESPKELISRRRQLATIDIDREPEPYLEVRCQIPISEINIPDWYNCKYSEFKSYLKVLSDQKFGKFEVKNINGNVLNVDPKQSFESNVQLCHEHLVYL